MQSGYLPPCTRPEDQHMGLMAIKNICERRTAVNADGG
jgi:hypothetical protein